MLKSTILAFIGILSTQATNFIVSVLLARVLLPEQFGQVALLSIFVAFCDIFVEGGFSTALIQKKDADEKDFSTVAFFSFGIAVICYALLFFSAEYISSYFSIEHFSNKLRIIGVIIFPRIVLSLQTASCKKRFEYAKLYSAIFCGNILSGILALLLARNGFGVFALIYQRIANTVIVSLIILCLSSPRFLFVFDKERFQSLFGFGWRIFFTDFMRFCFENVRTVIIGKKYELESLGYYDRGKAYANLATTSISSTITAVMLPYLSKVQDSPQESKQLLRNAIQVTTFIVYPLIFGMIACGKSLIILLLTEKWLPSVVFLQIFALYGLWAKPQIICQEALKAKGLSKKTLEIEIIRKIIEVISLVISVYIGMKAIAFSTSFACILSWFPVAMIAKKHLNYQYREQCYDCLPSLLISFLMGICIYFFNKLNCSSIIIIIIQVLVGVSVFFALAVTFKVPGYSYLSGRFIEFVMKYKAKQ
jgi:O-antigen/teichoic acid export membrane protein